MIPMALKNSKSMQNILTGVIVALALILLLVVILVKTGVFDKKETTTAEPETVTETAIVLESQTQENGDVTYYTVFSVYVRPKVSSNHVYPTTKPVTTETTVGYVEMTEIEYETDENGSKVVDENGQAVTKVVKYTVPADSTTTEEPTTVYVQKTEYKVVTDPVFHKPKKDKDGNVITELVTLDMPPTEKPDIWGESVDSTTASGEDASTDSGAVRDDSLAQSIVAAINADREEAGLEKLSDSIKLKGMARAKSNSSARPDEYGDAAVSGKVYEFKTTYGGKALYDDIINSTSSLAMSGDVSEVGVGVVKYMDTYYTTVIFE